jgi:ribosomal protein S18 acetylase RimI-like enzyme
MSIRKFLIRDRNSFDCGILDLNIFIKQEARQQQSKNLNKTFVLVDEENNSAKILAYYFISMCEIQLKSIPNHIKNKLPKYPIPAARIGRLAVDKSVQNKGIGKLTLVDALIRIKQVSLNIGVYAVIVDAKNKIAKKFYKHFGFIEFEDNSMSLFLPVNTLPNEY